MVSTPMERITGFLRLKLGPIDFETRLCSLYSRHAI